jgi:hypothetical protein
MARWCRGYWSSQGRVEKGWNWVAECTGGLNNTCVGLNTASGSTGQYNSCFGVSAGIYLTTGSNNVFLGNTCGTQVTTGNKNICIGYQAGSAGGILIGEPSGHAADQVRAVDQRDHRESDRAFPSRRL